MVVVRTCSTGDKNSRKLITKAMHNKIKTQKPLRWTEPSAGEARGDEQMCSRCVSARARRPDGPEPMRKEELHHSLLLANYFAAMAKIITHNHLVCD